MEPVEHHYLASRLYFSLQKPIATWKPKDKVNPGTADLLHKLDEIMRKHLIPKGVEYDDFVAQVRKFAELESGPHTVDGKSADWYVAYNYFHSGLAVILTLIDQFQLMEEAGIEVLKLRLPITEDFASIPTLEELKRSEDRNYRLTYAEPRSHPDAISLLEEFRLKKHRDDRPVFPGLRLIRQGKGFNVAFIASINEEPWQPTGNEVIDKLIDRWCQYGPIESSKGSQNYSGTSLFSDDGGASFARTVPDSFLELHEFDNGYRREFYSRLHLAFVSWSEGSITIEVCPNQSVFDEIWAIREEMKEKAQEG
ncbi:MAG TPA: hypothetical protein V6D07_18605 [Trichocoleus sp.]